MGGNDNIQLTRSKLNIDDINTNVSDETCGAIAIFIGTTRDNFEGKRVVSLEYEAYEPMAVKEMQIICNEVRSKWVDVVKIAFHHRLGLVPVKEASVVVAISSPHRQSALDAVEYAVNELKRRVPIWKKEIYDNDKSEWKENKECQWLSKPSDV